MYLGFSIFLFIGSLMPGFFLFQFFRDAMAEYKASGKYFWETLLSSPVLFFICLFFFLVLLGLSIFSLLLALA